jgi:PhnB protein
MQKNKVSPIPEDFHTITPQLVVRGVTKAIDFYQRAFGASELYRNMAPDGTSIMHSEMLLGDSRFFVNDEFLEWGVLSPEATNGSPVTLHLYVEDVDAVFEQATSAGAEVLLPINNAFWGDRYGILKDPFGHRWSVASRLEDLSPAEVQQRAKVFASNFGKHE